jgi:hypothetical protein
MISITASAFLSSTKTATRAFEKVQMPDHVHLLSCVAALRAAGQHSNKQ